MAHIENRATAIGGNGESGRQMRPQMTRGRLEAAKTRRFEAARLRECSPEWKMGGLTPLYCRSRLAVTLVRLDDISAASMIM